MSGKFKSIRDPLYGFVRLSEQETDAIDVYAYQRLRWIKQLSHAYVAYPTAVHTRFEHSLGAAHIAGRMCEKLDICGEDVRSVRMAVLLHDIGHGPMSHLFESVLKKINPGMHDIHEFISRSIISTDEELDTILGSQKEEVMEILSGGRGKESGDLSILADVTAGNLDADKLDYLRRDSFHAGVTYGQFDLERILHTIRRTDGSYSRVCVDKKGIDAVENYRLARYLMHAQVYKHHARLAADRMFLRALDIAIYEEHVIDRSRFKIRTGKSDANGEFLRFYMTLDDDSLYRAIVDSPRAARSKKLLMDIRRRRLWKRACQFSTEEINDAVVRANLVMLDQTGLDAMASEIAVDAGMPEEDVVIHVAEINTGLFGEGDLLFAGSDGTPSDIKEVSPISSAGGITRYFVFTPADKAGRERIRDEFAKRLRVEPSRIVA